MSGAAARTEFLKNKERINYCNIDSKGFCENTKTKSGIREKGITDSIIGSQYRKKQMLPVNWKLLDNYVKMKYVSWEGSRVGALEILLGVHSGK